MLCDDLEGWDQGWVLGGRLKRDGDVWIYIADSCCSTAETNTAMKSNYPPIKNK